MIDGAYSLTQSHRHSFHLFQCLLAGFLMATLATQANANERPNVVLIMADDLGYETVGCYGGTSYQTPNIDRLAAAGLKFDRAYAMPLCTNTRIQLMTGKYNIRNWKAFGILDPNEKTFGQLVQQAGYKTCMAGKWQLTSYDPPDYPGGESRRNTGMHPRDAGFDQYCLWHVGHTETKGSRYADPVIDQNGQPLRDTRGKYGPDIWTDFIGNFMEQNQDEPFFVYYAMALPHNPMVPTPDSPAWNHEERRHQDETRFAKDMIEYTDKMVGKVVDKLEQLDLRRKTLILFYSDNGTNARVTSMLGSRMVRGGKGKGTELGIRVPAVACWEGEIQAGSVSQDLVDSVDFLPTILDAAGAKAQTPIPIDGVSFLPLATGKGTGQREWVYIHQDPRPGWDKDRFQLIRLALDQRFKLYEDGRLYDLNDDPFEVQPLFIAADSDSARAARTKLQRVLDARKPYPMFDPATVPRPDPSDRFQGYQFQDQGGYVVVEAEALPILRDESWLVEGHLPGYVGMGYLRSLRDQVSPPPRKGATLIDVSIDVAGAWRVAVRCRSDHVSGDSERKFWVKFGDEHWRVGKIPRHAPSGKWAWVEELISPQDGSVHTAEFQFSERSNLLWIAPYSANVKIDRVILYQSDRKQVAFDLATPMTEYHPWASP